MTPHDELDAQRLNKPAPAPTPPDPPRAGAATASHPAPDVHLPTSPAVPPAPLSVQLELLVHRDRMIQSELLRLQRTLSRQQFRGAESARRLVRKLARKAEQNVTELDTLLRSCP